MRLVPSVKRSSVSSPRKRELNASSILKLKRTRLVLAAGVSLLIFKTVQILHMREVSKALSKENSREDRQIFLSNKNSLSKSEAAFLTKLHVNSTEFSQFAERDSAAASGAGNCENTFAARRQKLDEACQGHRTLASYGGIDFVPFDHLRWYKQRNLVVCFSAKVGSTSWIQHLLTDGYPLLYQKNRDFSNRALHLLASRYFRAEGVSRQEKTEQLMNSVKIVNVRHPFVRLVSAYRDKLEPCQGQTKCLFGEDFVKDSWWKLVDFKTFVEYLLEKIPKVAEAKRSTFDKFDQHWRPYFLNCGVCDINYDFIVKMETWDDDVRFILAKLGFQLGEEFHGNSRDSAAVALDYMRQTLSQSQVLDLYERYRLDFELFGYDVNEFLT